MIDRHLSDAGHDPHVQDDVLAVGDLHADFREPRARRTHQEGDDVHRPALHCASVKRRELLARVVGRHPIVVRAGVLPLLGADEGEVLGARDVVRRAAVQVAAGQLLLVQLDQLTSRHAFADQPVLLALRPVAEDHPVRRGQLLDLVDPTLDRGVLGCHRFSSWKVRRESGSSQTVEESRAGRNPRQSVAALDVRCRNFTRCCATLRSARNRARENPLTAAAGRRMVRAA